MPSLISDVNVEKPLFRIYLKRVGVENIRVPVFSIDINHKTAAFVPSVSAFIDLVPDYRGIHASRNYEAIVEVLSRYAKKKLKIEVFCSKVAKELLQKHPYCRKAEVILQGDVVYPTETPVTGKETFERAVLLGSAKAERIKKKIKINKAVGVKVSGITACPSAQKSILLETMNSLKEDVGDEEKAKKLVEKLFIATHMQRSYATLVIEVPGNYSVNAYTLIEIARNAMSAPTFELLKKKDEIEVVKQAVKKARFAEDVIRYMAKGVIDKFPNLPDETEVSLIQEDLESIHEHNLVAEYHATLKQLRKEFELK